MWRKPLFFSIFLALLTSPAVLADSITVSAAISLRDSLATIATDFQSQTGHAVQLNFGASGQLAAQISEGAPVDAFVSSGVNEMDQLAKAGLIDPKTRRIVCRNQLVLIVPIGSTHVPKSFFDLTDSVYQRIAVCTPASVPAGRYAQQVFEHLQIADALKPKLVYGQNVLQVLEYVNRGDVDAGVVYFTDALLASKKVRLAAKADPSWHSPIVYPAAVVSHSANVATAREFLDYLSGPSARPTLAADGFLTGPLASAGKAAATTP